MVFCGQRNRLFTTGFSRSSERQFALWNPVSGLATGTVYCYYVTCTLQEALDQALVTENIDQASGVLFPFWDEGTHMVYLVGKVVESELDSFCIVSRDCLMYRETHRSGTLRWMSMTKFTS